MDRAMLEMDPDQSGSVSLDELGQWYLTSAHHFRAQMKAAEREAQAIDLRALFAAADEDGSGEIDYIEAEELLKALFGNALTNSEQRQVVQAKLALCANLLQWGRGKREQHSRLNRTSRLHSMPRPCGQWTRLATAIFRSRSSRTGTSAPGAHLNAHM